MKYFSFSTIREYSIFFFLILIIIIVLIIYSINSDYKKENFEKINSSLDNTYLKKTIKEITNNLKPRFTYFEYSTKSGDNHQDIIDKLNISKKEKKKILETILKEKKLKILNINQKFIFKLDNLSEEKIIEFKVETGKKNEIVFSKSNMTSMQDSVIKTTLKNLCH